MQGKRHVKPEKTVESINMFHSFGYIYYPIIIFKTLQVRMHNEREIHKSVLIINLKGKKAGVVQTQT